MLTGESGRRRVMMTHAIRALLLGSEDGLTTGELARSLGITNGYANAVLGDEYGFYVDRWAKNPSGSDVAVWMCVPVPANCPRPDPVKPGEKSE